MGAVQVTESDSLLFSSDSVDSGGTVESTPRFVISSGSCWYWNISLLRGETCQVSASEWMPWKDSCVTIAPTVLIGVSVSSTS